jgi:amino acid transporter
MISERIAPTLVARTLGPFDLVVVFVAIVLFINNSAGVQFAGPSMFIFWPIAFATFLITGAFVTAQLGRMFPEEGSLYVWIPARSSDPSGASLPGSWPGGPVRWSWWRRASWWRTSCSRWPRSSRAAGRPARSSPRTGRSGSWCWP